MQNQQISMSSRTINGHTVYTYNGQNFNSKEEMIRQIKSDNPGYGIQSPSSQGGFGMPSGRHTQYIFHSSNGGDFGRDPFSKFTSNGQFINGNGGRDWSNQRRNSINRNSFKKKNNQQNNQMNFEQMIKLFFEQTNKYRITHRVEPLKYNNEIANAAQKWAERLSKSNVLKHDPDERFGENLAWSTGSPADSVIRWYQEVRDYDFRTGNSRGVTGHFTALVWKGSKQMGCGIAHSNNGYYVSCKYFPPGNVVGYYRQNVFPGQK